MIIQLQKLILIFLRISSFMVICPGFSFKGLPNTVKVALSIGFSMMVYTIIGELEIVDSYMLFFLLSIKEVFIGLILGYITKLIFAVIEMAGSLVDFQAGFTMGAVYDPSMGIRAANYGRLYYWLSICVFFIFNFHHRFIESIILSFRYIPLDTWNFAGFGTESIVKLFSMSFELAVNLAVPMIIVLLMVDMVLGIISKSVPQINVLMLGMPMKKMVSFLFTLIIMSWIMDSMSGIISMAPEYMESFYKMLGTN